MSNPRIQTILVALALLARLLMGIAPTHWVCVALSYAFDGEPDGATDISGPITALGLLPWLGAIAIIRRQEWGRARMAKGPGMTPQWRLPVFIMGSLNTIGGLILLYTGSQSAAYLALGLGVTMIGLELLAIVGAADVEPADDQVAEAPQPVELPKWVLPAAYCLTFGFFIFMAGARVATVPVVLMFAVIGASNETMSFLELPIQLVGYAVGVGLAWMVWQQISGYLGRKAEAGAAAASEQD